MSGGVPKHGGLCPLAGEGDEGAKNKRKRNEMTLWIQPIPNDRLKATAAAVSYSASLYNTLQFISGSPLYSLHYSIVDCGLNAVLKNLIGFQLSTYTLHIKIHRVYSRPEVPLFWVVNNAKHLTPVSPKSLLFWVHRKNKAAHHFHLNA